MQERTAATKFSVSCKIAYSAIAPVTLLGNFRARSMASQIVIAEKVTVTPPMECELVVTESDQNRFDRLRIIKNQEITIAYNAEVEVTHRFLNPEPLRKVSPANLNQAQLPFLLPSRYCQSDLLWRFAWQKFGHVADPFDQVREIVSWIHGNIQYIRGTTTSATSAYDTVTQCAGVCRDFAHLGIALCRALTIPARYFTGYAFKLEPPDFHAWFEAYIGGSWVLFDATRLVPLNGLVSIGVGRDAADVSVCTVFGNAQLVSQEVMCLVKSPEFNPLDKEAREQSAISIESGV